MKKEKFQIPFPDESTISHQINHIVKCGVKRKESFSAYLKTMYEQVGLRHLFSDRSELTFMLITALTIISIYIFSPDPASAKTDDLYAFIFLFSPVLFIALSIYTYSNKIINATYEVEMVCKYNVFQIIAFRMLLFSIITILINSLMILFIVIVYDNVQFFRAFMISNSGLFIFSIIFLFVMMKRQKTIFAISTIFGWLIGNLLLTLIDNKFYKELLVNMPLFIYGIIIIGSILVYIKCLKRLINYKPIKEFV